MDWLWQDLRVAARGLWKDRAFTITTMATLALCLAANVAIFAVVDGVLLKPFRSTSRTVSSPSTTSIRVPGSRSPRTACPTTTTDSRR